MPGTVLFICTGNTCRSPMAERLLKHALMAEKEPLNQLEILSAGVAAGNGYPASSNSVAALNKVGIDLNDHLTTQVTEALLNKANYIFGMTRGHIESARYMMDEQDNDRIFLMREFIEGVENLEITDPFGRGFADYENARDSMVEAIPSLIQFLIIKFPKES
ncbi:MAG: low molecular weight protein arginine phosphatase [Verrucomicrobia bacterium]|nr:low molecular weight protein arginine phosphatase [Verrucomicrobiota bacterium]